MQQQPNATNNGPIRQQGRQQQPNAMEQQSNPMRQPRILTQGPNIVAQQQNPMQQQRIAIQHQPNTFPSRILAPQQYPPQMIAPQQQYRVTTQQQQYQRQWTRPQQIYNRVGVWPQRQISLPAQQQQQYVHRFTPALQPFAYQQPISNPFYNAPHQTNPYQNTLFFDPLTNCQPINNTPSLIPAQTYNTSAQNITTHNTRPQNINIHDTRTQNILSSPHPQEMQQMPNIPDINHLTAFQPITQPPVNIQLDSNCLQAMNKEMDGITKKPAISKGILSNTKTYNMAKVFFNIFRTSKVYIYIF